ncbi:MAG: hypothetical protein ACFCUQ_12540 [Kiloniellales bacterium]
MPWKLPDSDADLLALAKGYPFPAPEGSYLFRGGRAEPLAGDFTPVLYDGRVPVLAHGSNRSPEQLARKFGATAEIPVTVGWLADYDVVYSAHVTQYGSIASTVQHLPGARARIFITWLDEAQLARMHETEGPSSYLYGRLRDIDLRMEAGPGKVVRECNLYLSRNGCLARQAAPVGLAAVTAEGRMHEALPQPAVLAHVHERYRPHLELDAMILRKIRNAELRRALVEELRADAVPAAAPHFQAGGA